MRTRDEGREEKKERSDRKGSIASIVASGESFFEAVVPFERCQPQQIEVLICLLVPTPDIAEAISGPRTDKAWPRNRPSRASASSVEHSALLGIKPQGGLRVAILKKK